MSSDLSDVDKRSRFVRELAHKLVPVLIVLVLLYLGWVQFAGPGIGYLFTRRANDPEFLAKVKELKSKKPVAVVFSQVIEVDRVNDPAVVHRLIKAVTDAKAFHTNDPLLRSIVLEILFEDRSSVKFNFTICDKNKLFIGDTWQSWPLYRWYIARYGKPKEPRKITPEEYTDYLATEYKGPPKIEPRQQENGTQDSQTEE